MVVYTIELCDVVSESGLHVFQKRTCELRRYVRKVKFSLTFRGFGILTSVAWDELSLLLTIETIMFLSGSFGCGGLMRATTRTAITST